MKSKILIIFVSFLSLTNCSLDEDNIVDSVDDNFIVEWHLINTKGGIAGIDDDFDLETIIWTFDTSDTLTVINNNADDSKQDFLDSGTYTYSTLDNNDDSYITVNDVEFGSFSSTSENTVLTIDTNELIGSSGSDGFIYTFQRILIEDN